jgi:ectoine hydroxylase-related dioxygenase (phytanoyl-CoA dioxygenase family)
VPHSLAPHELARYRERGYFVREALFDERELAHLREAVERVQAAVAAAEARGDAPVERIDDRRYQRLLGSLVKWEWEEGSRAIRSMEPFVHLDPRLDALVDDARLVAVARDLVGDAAVSLFTDKLNFKRPGGSPFPWHQDTPYWAFGCGHLDRLASVQLYLDAATRENGCLWVIPGSHRAGFLPAQEDGTVLGRLYTDVERLPGAEPVALEAPAGSAVWFDGAVVHGSRGNRSRGSRRAIVLTYQPAGHPRWNRADVRVAGAR